MRSTARRSSTACGPAAPACRPACSGSSTARCSSPAGRVPEYDPTKAQELLKAGQLQGRSDPVPPAQQLLHQPGGDGADPGRDVASRSGSTSRSRCARTGRRSSRTTATRARARLVEQRRLQRSRVSSLVAQHGPNGQQQQVGEWTNDEMNKLCGSAGDLRPTSPRARRRSSACWRSAEREDPAYTVLHQNATFTAKREGHQVEGGAGLRDGFPRRAISSAQGLMAAPLVSSARPDASPSNGVLVASARHRSRRCARARRSAWSASPAPASR